MLPTLVELTCCVYGKEQVTGKWTKYVITHVLSRSVVSDSLQSHGLQPARILCPWDFPGKNTGVGCHFLLQRIKFASPEGLLHWQAGSFTPEIINRLMEWGITSQVGRATLDRIGREDSCKEVTFKQMSEEWEGADHGKHLGRERNINWWRSMLRKSREFRDLGQREASGKGLGLLWWDAGQWMV